MRGARGLSLVELLVVLVIGALVASLATPSFTEVVRRQQLAVAANDLLGAIVQARSQAVARGRMVLLAPLDAAGQDWSQGWTVFIDHDRNRRPGGADEIIAVHGPLPDGVLVELAMTSNTAPQYIAYNGAGRSCSDSNDNSARFGTLSLFHGDGIRRIKINMLGRARLCDPARSSACDGALAPQ